MQSNCRARFLSIFGIWRNSLSIRQASTRIRTGDLAGYLELAQPTRNDESTRACFVADFYGRIFSVRFTKSRQQLLDSLKIIADGSIESHFPVSTALSYRDGG
jgi:hypothetical protein